jgi:hypothetical protein
MTSINPQQLNNIHNALSSPRLTRYLALSNQDLARAIALHNWNTKLGSALNLPLQLFELSFRNSLDTQLATRFGVAWYDVQMNHFNAKTQSQIQAAKDQLTKQSRPHNPPCIIAQFTFGFWLTLLTRRLETNFWVPALHRSFPHAPIPVNRANIHSSVDKIRWLRNRIAHHEPVYTRNLEQDLDHIVMVAGWICPDTAAFIESYRIDLKDVLANKP